MVRLLLLSAVLSGCMRFGFDDASRSDAALDARAADQSKSDGGVVGPDDPCHDQNNPCPAGQLCTGSGLCRPPCTDGGVCPDGELCGPIDDGGATVPTACLPTEFAGRYEDCKTRPCAPPLKCGRGVNFDVCVKPCTAGTDCEQGEDCVEGGMATRICLLRCNLDAECPTDFHCLGFASSSTDNYCMSDLAAVSGEDCKGRPCPTNMRCFGILSDGPHGCYPLCSQGSTCVDTNRVCADHFHSLFNYCQQICDPFSAAACGANEICLPSLPVREYICVPANGSTSSCIDAPCATGLVCVNSKCEELCDASHPCSSGSCTTLGLPTGEVAPWRACL